MVYACFAISTLNYPLAVARLVDDEQHYQVASWQRKTKQEARTDDDERGRGTMGHRPTQTSLNNSRHERPSMPMPPGWASSQ